MSGSGRYALRSGGAGKENAAQPRRLGAPGRVESAPAKPQRPTLGAAVRATEHAADSEEEEEEEEEEEAGDQDEEGGGTAKDAPAPQPVQERKTTYMERKLARLAREALDTFGGNADEKSTLAGVSFVPNQGVVQRDRAAAPASGFTPVSKRTSTVAQERHAAAAAQGGGLAAVPRPSRLERDLARARAEQKEQGEGQRQPPAARGGAIQSSVAPLGGRPRLSRLERERQQRASGWTPVRRTAPSADVVTPLGADCKAGPSRLERELQQAKEAGERERAKAAMRQEAKTPSRALRPPSDLVGKLEAAARYMPFASPEPAARAPPSQPAAFAALHGRDLANANYLARRELGGGSLASFGAAAPGAGLGPDEYAGLPAERCVRAGSGACSAPSCAGDACQGDAFRRLPACGHRFHDACLARHAKASRVCPSCGTPAHGRE